MKLHDEQYESVNFLNEFHQSSHFLNCNNGNDCISSKIFYKVIQVTSQIGYLIHVNSFSETAI